MGYYKNVLGGIYWIGSLRVITRVLAFLKIAILARLLNPEEFGNYAIASLVLVFLETITETGINAYLIQEEDIKKSLDATWIVSIVRGLLISLLIIIFSKPVSTFFNAPNVLPILFLISTVPFLKGFINPSVINYQKNLLFKKDFILRLTIFTVDTLTCVLLAIYLKSAIVLVWGMIVGAITEILISFTFIKPLPRLKFKSYQIKILISRGKWITLSGIFRYLFENIDDLVVGRLINTYSLGLYQVAYKISSLPMTESAEVFHKVTFPIFVKVRNDPVRLKKAFLKVFIAVTLLVIPFGVILLFFASPIIKIFLGDKWLQILSVVRVLVVYGIIRAIFGISTPLFLAIKKQKYITIITFTAILGLSLTIIPFVRLYGYLGAGYSALFGWLLAIPVIIYYLNLVFKNNE